MTDDSRRLAARLIAASPLAISIADARANTHERRRKLLASPSTVLPPQAEPDLTQPDPALAPSILEPDKFADRFWNARTEPAAPKPPQKPKPKKQRPGRPPVGDLPPDVHRFRVVDGDKK